MPRAGQRLSKLTPPQDEAWTVSAPTPASGAPSSPPSAQAEFAADLQQASEGDGPAEYRDPVEFFRRTYLTENLKGMLADAVQRLTDAGGDPVVGPEVSLADPAAQRCFQKTTLSPPGS